MTTDQTDISKRLAWTREHHLAALRQGWLLADRDGQLCVQRVDDPADTCADNGLQPGEVPLLADDEAAFDLVLRGALAGEPTCRLAAEILNNSDLVSNTAEAGSADQPMGFDESPPEGYAPLPRWLYDEARRLGVIRIDLAWSGGSDEGYLNVAVIPETTPRSFVQLVEQWAWKAIEYSGAGDGADYGDDITYDLANNTVTHEGWYHVPTYEEPRTFVMVVMDEKSEGDAKGGNG